MAAARPRATSKRAAGSTACARLPFRQRWWRSGCSAPRSRFPAAVIQQALQPLRGMRLQSLLVRLGAPAGTVGNDEVPLLDIREMGEELVVPFEPVDIDLHDAQVRHGGG